MRSVAALALSVLTLAVAPAAAHAADWVGLGDSYAAGPLIPNQSLSPLGCLRSDHNYVHLAVPAGASLSDVSCSGAKTTNMTGSQSTSAGTNPPQFNALSAATKVVTLQISGNDIGFTEIIQNCATANPFGRPCQDRYVVNGVDEIRARITAVTPKVAEVIHGIHQRSPSAKVLVVNYAAIFPTSGSGCWPQVPIAFADVPYLRGIQRRAELDARAAGGRERGDDRRRVHGVDRQGRVQVLRHPLGGAAGPGQRGGPVPPQRPR